MIRYYLAPLFWAGIILFLSSIPSNDLPDFSFWTLFSFDKFAHVVMYAILSFQVMKACVRQYANKSLRYKAVKVSVVTGVIYGGLIELFQEYMLTDRYGDWMDLISNIVGTILGIVLFKLIFFEYVQ
ncbi:MAG: VanZ family protein [Bacteroidetes bacterium]|nr:VanZ family protein [Bacteroidota bacterium]